MQWLTLLTGQLGIKDISDEYRNGPVGLKSGLASMHAYWDRHKAPCLTELAP